MYLCSSDYYNNQTVASNLNFRKVLCDETEISPNGLWALNIKCVNCQAPYFTNEAHVYEEILSKKI